MLLDKVYLLCLKRNSENLRKPIINTTDKSKLFAKWSCELMVKLRLKIKKHCQSFWQSTNENFIVYSMKFITFKWQSKLCAIINLESLMKILMCTAWSLLRSSVQSKLCAIINLESLKYFSRELTRHADSYKTLLKRMIPFRMVSIVRWHHEKMIAFHVSCIHSQCYLMYPLILNIHIVMLYVTDT